MNYRNLRPAVLAIFSLIGASNVDALVIEAPNKGAVLGSAIKFNLRATLAPGEDASTLCIKADVLQADASIPPSKVSVQFLGGGATRQGVVQISSAVVIEEPVLNLVIRSGCSQQVTRKFVIFADPPSAINPLESIAGTQLAPSKSRVSNQQQRLEDETAKSVAGPFVTRNSSEPDIRSTLKKTEKNSLQSAGSNRRSAEPLSTQSEKSLTQSRRLASDGTQSSRSRLQLDVVGGATDPSTNLRSSSELVTLPLENTPQRAEAAALWRALSASSTDLQKDLQLLDALRLETLELKNASAKSQIESAKNIAQLKAAENQRYSNPLVYGLAAMLALAVLAFLMFRTSPNHVSPVWWKTRREKNETDAATSGGLATEPVIQQPSVVRQPVRASIVKAIERLPDRIKHEILAKEVEPRLNEIAFHSIAFQANPRGLNVEELFDIQQQADFFISLGQHDQAIEVLKNHINENAQTSPLVYLDLLSLYHSQNKSEEYGDLAGEFSKLFTGVVPAFLAFNQKTLGLEAYPSLLGLIEGLWHTIGITSVIEDFIFRGNDNSAEALDLEAYRELLLLYSITKDLGANEIVATDRVELDVKFDEGPMLLQQAHSSATKFVYGVNSTFPNALQIKDRSFEEDGANFGNRSVSSQKPVGARIGLDIDLTSCNLDHLSAFASNPTAPPLTSNQKNTHQTEKTGFIKFDMNASGDDVDKTIEKEKNKWAK